MFGLIYSWGTIAPAIHVQSGWSQSILDLTFSLTPLALLPSVVTAGHGLRRITPKTMLAAALGCFTLGGLAGLAIATPLAFLLGYGVLALGCGAGLSTAACIAIVSRHHPHRRGMLSGALLALYGASSAVSAPLFHWFDGPFHWRGALAILMALYGAAGWICLTALPAIAAPDRHAARPAGLWRLLRHPPLRAALGLILLAAPLGSAAFAVIGHLAHDLGYAPPYAVAAVAVMAMGNGVGRLGFGTLADLRSPLFARDAALMVNALAAAILLAGLTGLDGGMTLLFPPLMGLAFGGMAGKLAALANRLVAGSADQAFGLLFGTFALASFLGPLADATFGMRPALVGLALAALLAWPLARLVARPRAIDAPERSAAGTGI